MHVSVDNFMNSPRYDEVVELVRDPRAAMEGLSRFLGLDFEFLGQARMDFLQRLGQVAVVVESIDNQFDQRPVARVLQGDPHLLQQVFAQRHIVRFHLRPGIVVLGRLGRAGAGGSLLGVVAGALLMEPSASRRTEWSSGSSSRSSKGLSDRICSSSWCNSRVDNCSSLIDCCSCGVNARCCDTRS